MPRTFSPQGRSTFVPVLILSVVTAVIPVLSRSQATPDVSQGKPTSERRVPKEPAIKTVPQDLIPTLVKPQVSCEQTCAQSKAFDPSFQRNPPVVKNVSLQIIKGEGKTRNAKLVVDFARDARLKDSLTILVGDAPAILKRTSGTSYTGLINFDFPAFEAELKRHEALVHEGKSVPVFENRLLKRNEKLASVSFNRERILAQLDPNLLRNLLNNPANIDPDRELMIKDTGVVDDPARTFNPCTSAGIPMGIWTFGHLMTEMANQPSTGVDPSDFVLNWLNAYTVNQTINGWPVAPRGGIQGFINSWPKLANGKLDLSKAPFLLLAIVNRVDLRASFVYGGGGNAGEARFVFGAVSPSGGCGTLPFTVIFEYGIKKSNCGQLHAWAQQWHNLATQPVGSPAFNVFLQSITDQFTVANADPSKSNGSALNQLRTNEISFGSPWELREFNIVSTHQLQEVFVKQTPDLTLNNSSAVRDYINANEASLLAGTNQVPLFFPGATHFVGGSAINIQTAWNGTATVNNNDARQQLSVNTCNACHGRETLDNNFLQIAPRTTGGTAQLSAFLTGETIPDPVVPATIRTYNDLLRRQVDLDNLLNSSCFSLGALKGLTFRPLVMTH
jgi:hypothetical protein